jgi:hypothetical protein
LPGNANVTPDLEGHMRLTAIRLSLPDFSSGAPEGSVETHDMHLMRLHGIETALACRSELDQVRGIRAADYLSVVCPHYAHELFVGWAEYCSSTVLGRKSCRVRLLMATFA